MIKFEQADTSTPKTYTDDKMPMQAIAFGSCRVRVDDETGHKKRYINRTYMSYLRDIIDFQPSVRHKLDKGNPDDDVIIPSPEQFVEFSEVSLKCKHVNRTFLRMQEQTGNKPPLKLEQCLDCDSTISVLA